MVLIFFAQTLTYTQIQLLTISCFASLAVMQGKYVVNKDIVTYATQTACCSLIGSIFLTQSLYTILFNLIVLTLNSCFVCEMWNIAVM